MNEINIAELLKDCPKGMELYSTIFGVVYFERVRGTSRPLLIDVKTSCNTEMQFHEDGKFNTYYSDSEMTLFPSKDVRTWEGFVPPCKFKVGDKVVFRDAKDKPLTIRKIWWDNEILCSFNEDDIDVPVEDLDRYVTPKFDINTLKPFDKVLVRGDVGQRWIIDFFGFMDNKKGCPFVCVGHYVIQCVPYEGNERLLGTTDDCDEYYKNW